MLPVSNSTILSDMVKKLSPKQLEKRLDQCQKHYERIKARIRDVGFICEGTLTERWTSCGKPNCRCTGDPPQRHGPYHQLTWKERGKTVTRRLSAKQAHLYQEWVTHRRELEALLGQMRDISWEAGGYLLEAADTSEEAAESLPRPPRRPTSTRP